MSMKFLKTVAPAALTELWEKVSGAVKLKDTSLPVQLGSVSGTDHPLNVGSDGGSNVRLVGRDNGTTDEAAITFQHNDGSTVHGMITGKDTTLVLSGGTATGMTIDSAGNVAIGATGATIYNTAGLEVGDGTNATQISLFSGTSTSSEITFADGTSGTDRYKGMIRYNHTSDKMEFYSEAAKDVTFEAGDLTVHDGDVYIGTAGKGINFSAQTATSASGATTTAELLDHYEEGSWTPAWVATGTAPTTLSYGHQEGYYTRIGRQVTCSFKLNIDTFTAGSISGDLLLSGLPFTAKNITNTGAAGSGVLSYTYVLNSSYDWPRTLWANDNAATAYASAFDSTSANNSTLKDLTNNIILSLASGANYMGEITYIV